jgi:alpha-tubulin suppressor-like RCC1 family protein
LGDGQSGAGHQNPSPTIVPGISSAFALRAGGDTTCAFVGENVACWGDGTYGQLGAGTAGDGHCQTSPYLIPNLHSVLDLSISSQNVCAVTRDGSTYCWGLNSSSEWLGFSSGDCGPFTNASDGTSSFLPCETAPRQVPSVQNANVVASGGQHNCVILFDGTTQCWGDNTFGQLGTGSAGASWSASSASTVNALPVAQKVALGTSHSCALTIPTSEVWCWGDNSFGQLGTGPGGDGGSALESSSASPTALSLTSGVVDISAQGNSTCAVNRDGTVSCWGDASALLPLSVDSGAGSVTTPTEATGVANAVAVRTGAAHACVRHGNDYGSVACWGLNDHGQLGNGAIGSGDYTTGVVADLPQVDLAK